LTVVSINNQGGGEKLNRRIEDICIGDGPVPDILMVQETNTGNDNIIHIRIPVGWAAAHTATPIGHMKAVMTIARTGHLMGRDTLIESVLDISNEMFDILAVKVRGLLVINTYVHQAHGRWSKADVLDKITEEVSDLLIDHTEARIVFGGDYNLPDDQQGLLDHMQGLELAPVLPLSGKMEPTHAKGGVLDWIFVGGGIEAGPLDIITRGEDHFVLKTTLSIPLDDDIQSTRYHFDWKKLPRIRSSPEESKALMEAVETAATGATLTEFRERLLRDVLPKFLGRKRSMGSSLPRAWYEKDIKLARFLYRTSARMYQKNPTPENRDKMRATHKAYQRSMRKRTRQARAELARKVERKQASIYTLVTSTKKGARSQSRFIPNLEVLLKFWTTQFDHQDPLLHGWWEQMSEDAGITGGLPKVTFTVEQLREALSQIQDKKAPGDDDIRVSLFKGASDKLFTELARMLTEMANDIEPMPSWTKQSVGKMLYKQKGSRKDPSNYRIIVMAPLFAKIFEKMLENWGRALVSDGTLKIAQEQGGFMPNRSTHDNVFLLESVRDAQIKRSKLLYAVLLDLRKAFDTVDHKIFLQAMRNQSAPEEWIRLLAKMLSNRQLKLYDALVSLKVGTVQGSPVSPLLFILFINPLIERLKATGKGVNLINDNKKPHLINCLLFADDTFVLSDSLEDLDVLLEVCNTWAKDFGMCFNAGKSEIIQLAGKIPDERPEVKLEGEVIPWKKAVKYLGIIISEGRRKRLPAPTTKMWRSYHRIKRALDPKLPLSLRKQLLLIQADILNIALYPSPVRDLDYASIDRFINRLLCRVTGCSQRWTSATFLRAELGVPSSKYLAHNRALSYYWHLTREAWFCDLVPKLKGTGPLQRLQNMAALYKIDLDNAGDLTHGQWKTLVKKAIMGVAETDMNKDLQHRGYPVEAEAQLKPRNYVLDGGPDARYGLRFRWEQVRHTDSRFHDTREEEAGHDTSEEDEGCCACPQQHKPHISCFDDLFLDCETLIPEKHRAARLAAIQQIAKEISAHTLEGVDIPQWLRPHLKIAFESLSWPNKTTAGLRAVLAFLARVGKVADRIRFRKLRRQRCIHRWESIVYHMFYGSE
jgi:hypothetical protein